MEYSPLGGYFGEDPTALAEQLERELREQAARASQPQPVGAPSGGAVGGMFAQPAPPAPPPTSPSLQEIAQGVGGNALSGLANIYNTDVPIWSDFARDVVNPAGAAFLNSPLSPIGGISQMVQGLGGPDLGQTIADLGTPVSAGDVTLTFAPVVGDFPIDDIVRNAPDLARGAFRAAMPEPTLNPGLAMGIPAPGWGNPEDFLLSNGVDPTDALTRQDLDIPGGLMNMQARAAPTPYQQPAEFTPPNPEPARVGGYTPQEAYDAAYAATPSSAADKTLNAEAARQEVLSGEALPGNYSALPIFDTDGNLTMPGRLGPPPPADAAMRELGLGPDNARALEGGGSPIPPSAEALPVSPPPPSPVDELTLAREFVRNAPAGGTVPASTIGPTRDEAFATALNRGEVPFGSTSTVPTATPGVESVQEAIDVGRRLGYSDGDIAAYIRRNHLGDDIPFNTPAPPASFLAAPDPPPISYQALLDAANGTNRIAGEPPIPPSGGGGGIAGGGGGYTGPYTIGQAGDPSIPRPPSPDAGVAGGTPPPPPDLPTAIAAGGPPPSVAANKESMDLWDMAMDALRGPLGADIGTPFRQDITATLDITKIGQTREVMGLAARAFTSRAETLKVIDELQGFHIDKIDAVADRKINLHLPDIPGIRESKSGIHQETSQSNLFGRIPVLGAAYNSTGRANAMVLEARRVLDVSQFVDNLPNRILSTKDPEKIANQIQYYADLRAVTTGLGKIPGGPTLEKTLARSGQIFTALRYLLSIPQRVPYLLPVNRVAAGQWEVFGPAWRETAKEHAFFAGALAATYTAADKAGLSIKDKEGNYTGKIKAGSLTIDLTGGMAAYYNTIMKMADGDYMAGAEFLRNKTSPLTQAAVQGLRAVGVEGKFLDFMRPEFFDQGATGTGMKNPSGKGTDADRAAAAIVPLWMQSAAKAYNAAKLSGEDGWIKGAIAGAANFVGVNTSTFPVNARTPELNEAMQDPANLVGLPPNVVEFLKGKDWSAATPDEQRIIRGNLDPETLAKVEKGEQLLRDRNDIFQAARDQSKQIADTAAEKRAALEPIATGLKQKFDAGVEVSKTVSEMKRVESAADKAVREVYEKTPRLYDSKEYQEKIKDFPDKGAAQKEVDRIREIQDKYNGVYNDPRVIRPDGSRDYDRINLAQKAIMDTLRKEDAGFATRVEFNLQKNPGSDFELSQQIRTIENKLNEKGYYAVPTGSKTQFAREHPDVDALLSWLYGNPVHSQPAAQVLQALAPGRTVTYAR